MLGYWLIFRLGRATPLMLSVGAATIVTYLIRKRDLASLGWTWGSWKYQWMSYIIPLLCTTVAYMLIWGIGLGELNSEFITEQGDTYNLKNWNDTSLFFFHFALTASVSFIMLLPSVLGEEIAWRGFLVPELSKFMSFTGVALVSGVIWAIWHWYIIYLGLYGNEHTSLSYQLFFFTLFIVSSGVIMAYLRLKTNSLWTGVIFHMSSNIFLQKVFSPLTVETPNSAWYTDEFGAIPALVTCAVAIYFWKKGQQELL